MGIQQKNVLFWDLDGTLTDPADGIVHSVQYALRHYGLWAEREELLPFIGPPLAESFAERFGFSAEKSREAVEIYREYFKKDGWLENAPYPGIHELLGRLGEAGYRHYLASSKPEPLCRRILSHFGLDGYFAGIAGSDFEGTRAKKEQVIAYLLQREGLSPEEAWMIGDRRFDAEGAAQFSIPCIGVLWGYGSREELEAVGASVIVADFAGLEQFLIGK